MEGITNEKESRRHIDKEILSNFDKVHEKLGNINEVLYGKEDERDPLDPKGLIGKSMKQEHKLNSLESVWKSSYEALKDNFDGLKFMIVIFGSIVAFFSGTMAILNTIQFFRH